MAALTKNALEILNNRYFRRNQKGVIIENINQLFKRVATHVASAENSNKANWEKKFFHILKKFDFLPNSPTLMNAGISKGQLSACFVLPINNNLNSIFTSLKNTALIHQSSGGTGFNFSKISPTNNNDTFTGNQLIDPVNFIEIYDLATNIITQGGKRRGANMAILNVNHPQIEKFISCKSSKTKLQNFNISVGITNNFMQSVQDNNYWNLINPRTLKVEKKIKAKSLWNLIVEEAWKTGDPGLLFLDTINHYNPTPNLGRIGSTNPCGEVPLLDYESCNLGSINLSNMVSNNKLSTEINWKKLADTIEIAIRFLDNIIDVNHYIIPETEQITKKNRKIGLGVMGWAQLLLILNIPYASIQAIELGEKLMKFIKEKSLYASEKLAIEKGVFPEWEKSIYFNKRKLRNATVNSIAPTGTISIIANTSYSIEPLFALAFQRVGILGGKNQTEINKIFENQMKSLGLWTNQLKKTILKTGSIKGIKTIPENIKTLFETSLEIPWKYHLLHQKSFQKYTDNAVSKTINLPEKTSMLDISKIYWKAWKYNLKGITIYRYGSKTNQVIQKCTANNANIC